jgi:hypothetical protein
MDMPSLGKQPPRHPFFLNPHTDARFTKCPKCEGQTSPELSAFSYQRSTTAGL